LPDERLWQIVTYLQGAEANQGMASGGIRWESFWRMMNHTGELEIIEMESGLKQTAQLALDNFYFFQLPLHSP
jgi:hypothetical protein